MNWYQIFQTLLNLWLPKPSVPQTIPNIVEPRERLYNCALTFLGKDASPEGLASNDVACAESVSNVSRTAGYNFGKILGTILLADTLEKDSRFVEVFVPLLGAIIIYVSGTGNGLIYHGHTGIIGMNGKVMSNNSDGGIWDTHLTLDLMKNRYEIRGGMKPRYFIPR